MVLGTTLALTAGVLPGVFQVMHRKANENLPYNPFRLITLLAVSLIFTILIVLLSGESNQVKNIPPAAFFFFSISGFIHFFMGFYLMHISQVNIGVNKTEKDIKDLYSRQTFFVSDYCRYINRQRYLVKICCP